MRSNSADAQDKPAVAVVLPTYCEAGNIESLIHEIQSLELNCSIVVVDDSSPDGTAERVKNLQRKYGNLLLYVRPAKHGLGTAIADAFKLIQSLNNPPDYIITMDADYSHDPKEAIDLIRIAEKGCDLVVGSRYCEGGRIVGWSRFRWFISRLANVIASATIGMRMRDCTSGFRCYSRNCVKAILPNLHSHTYEIQIETIKQAQLRSFHVMETPITFVNRKQGKSKLTKTEVQDFLSYIARSLIKRKTTCS